MTFISQQTTNEIKIGLQTPTYTPFSFFPLSHRYIQDLQAEYPKELGTPAFSPSRLRWAQAIVCSRGLSVNGASMLLPVIDMLNHAKDGCVLRFNDAGAILVTTTRGYDEGDEVCLCYGDKQAPELLANYGYMPQTATGSEGGEGS